MKRNGLELSIQKHNDCFWLCGEGEYPRDSVLAGEYRFVKLEPYETLEEAIVKNPGVRVKDSALPGWLFGRGSDTPPSDFDPNYAGERWEED